MPIGRKKIAILGTLDTKGDQVDYLRSVIESKGHDTVVIDVGVLGEPTCTPTMTRHQVAGAAGMTLEEIITLGHKGQEAKSLRKMTEGARNILADLNEKENVDGVIALGGSMGTALALRAMEVLPLTLPKIILSTMAYSPTIDPDCFSHNIIMIPWIGGLWGINEVAKRILNQAAGAITATCEAYERSPISAKKLIGVSSFGMASSLFLFHLRPELEKRDCEVAVFHPTGMNSRLLEKAIEDGSIDMSLELTIGSELTTIIVDSASSPSRNRLEAAISRGIPMILSQGNMEVCTWGPVKPIPENYAGRRRYEHNPLLWIINTRLEDRLAAIRMLTEKLNRATGPTAFVFPRRRPLGITKYGLADPEGMDMIRQELKGNLKSDVNFVEVDCSADDAPFAQKVISLMDEMLG